MKNIVNLSWVAKEIESIVRLRMDIEKDLRCKFCNSSNVVRNGHRKGRQYWLCKSCGRGFMDNKALPGMRYSIDDIATAIYSYYAGSSLNQVRGLIEQKSGYRPSDSAIYSWIIRFSKEAIKETDKYTPNVGNTWVADETVLNINGQNYWLFDIIDSDTRFLLATHLTKTRTAKDAQILMERAAKRAGKIPKVVVTDKLASYLDGIEMAYGADSKHIQSKPFEIDTLNNLIERFHGTLKDRTKVLRGFKKPESAEEVIEGWLFYYNFLRAHDTLGKTPAEAAGVKFPHRNWLDILKQQETQIQAEYPMPSLPRYHLGKRTKRYKKPLRQKKGILLSNTSRIASCIR